MRVLFIYFAPHPIHAAFAETITHEMYGCGITYYQIIKKLIKALFTYPKREKYDVLFLESGSCIPLAILKKDSKTKIILLNADPLFYDLPKNNFIKRKIMEYLLSHVDELIVNSELNRKLALKYFNKGIYKVYPFGLNSNFKINTTLESKNILFIGNEGDYKGYNPLIDAIKNLNESGGEYDLYMVGSSSDKVELEYKWLHKEGFQSNKLDPYFKKCSIYVHPAEYESFGAVVLEAMSAGLIPIVTKNSGASEILEQNNLEFLILDNNNSNNIRDKIIEISTKPLEWKKEISLKCKAISSDFTREKQIKNFRKVINEIAESS